MVTTLYVDSVTNDRFNILLGENRIVLNEAREGAGSRSRTHFNFNPQSAGWKYLKDAIEFYERAQLLNGTH